MATEVHELKTELKTILAERYDGFIDDKRVMAELDRELAGCPIDEQAIILNSWIKVFRADPDDRSATGS